MRFLKGSRSLSSLLTFRRLHKFEATNPDVKLFVILREPVISNPFFEFEELSATKNSEYLNIYVMNKLVFVYGLNKNSSKVIITR